jgi:hypothetical protein
MSAILLVAFRRWNNIELILDRCAQSGASRIYMHLDAPRNLNDFLDVEKVRAKAENFRNSSNLDVKILRREKNIGCAAAVISSVSTILDLEKELVVLEDDCIPSPDFFQFMTDAFAEMASNNQIAVACGAQFAPHSVTGHIWNLSAYPLNWGWGTTRQQWFPLVSDIYNRKRLSQQNSKGKKFYERSYWNAGSRRALEGYSDVWDTLLVREMIKKDKYAILPGENLVTNVGTENFALHTSGDQLWTRHPFGNYVQSNSAPIVNLHLDSWLRENIFKISVRHFFSTKATRIKDLVTRSKKFPPLKKRLNLSKSYFV